MVVFNSWRGHSRKSIKEKFFLIWDDVLLQKVPYKLIFDVRAIYKNLPTTHPLMFVFVCLTNDCRNFHFFSLIIINFTLQVLLLNKLKIWFWKRGTKCMYVCVCEREGNGMENSKYLHFEQSIRDWKSTKSFKLFPTSSSSQS